MMTEIRQLALLRAGKVGAILYGLFGLVFLPIGLIATIADRDGGLK